MCAYRSEQRRNQRSGHQEEPAASAHSEADNSQWQQVRHSQRRAQSRARSRNQGRNRQTQRVPAERHTQQQQQQETQPPPGQHIPRQQQQPHPPSEQNTPRQQQQHHPPPEQHIPQQQQQPHPEQHVTRQQQQQLPFQEQHLPDEQLMPWPCEQNLSSEQHILQQQEQRPQEISQLIEQAESIEHQPTQQSQHAVTGPSMTWERVLQRERDLIIERERKRQQQTSYIQEYQNRQTAHPSSQQEMYYPPTASQSQYQQSQQHLHQYHQQQQQHGQQSYQGNMQQPDLQTLSSSVDHGRRHSDMGAAAAFNMPISLMDHVPPGFSEQWNNPSGLAAAQWNQTADFAKQLNVPRGATGGQWNTPPLGEQWNPPPGFQVEQWNNTPGIPPTQLNSPPGLPAEQQKIKMNTASSEPPTSQTCNKIKDIAPPAEPYNLNISATENLRLIKDVDLNTFDKELEKLRTKWATASLKQESYQGFVTILQSVAPIIQLLDPSFEAGSILARPPWFTPYQGKGSGHAIRTATERKRQKSTWDWTKEELYLAYLFEKKRPKKIKSENNLNTFDSNDDEVPLHASASQEDNSLQRPESPVHEVVCNRFGVETIYPAKWKEDIVCNTTEPSENTLVVEQLIFQLNQKLRETIENSKNLNIGPFGMNLLDSGDGMDEEKPILLSLEAQTDPHFGCDECGKSFRPQDDVDDFSTACQTENNPCVESAAQTVRHPVASVKVQTHVKTQTLHCQTVSEVVVQRSTQTTRMQSVPRKTQTTYDYMTSKEIQVQPQQMSLAIQTVVKGTDSWSQTDTIRLPKPCPRLECILRSTEWDFTESSPACIFACPMMKVTKTSATVILFRLLFFIFLLYLLSGFGVVTIILILFPFLVIGAILPRVLYSLCSLPDIAERLEKMYPSGGSDTEEDYQQEHDNAEEEECLADTVFRSFSWVFDIYRLFRQIAAIHKVVIQVEKERRDTEQWVPSIVTEPFECRGNASVQFRQFCHHRGVDLQMIVSDEGTICRFLAPSWYVHHESQATDELSYCEDIMGELLQCMGLQNTSDTSFLQHPDTRYALYWLAKARGESKKLQLTITRPEPEPDENAGHFRFTLRFGRVQSRVCDSEISAEVFDELEQQAANLLFHKLLFNWIQTLGVRIMLRQNIIG